MKHDYLKLTVTPERTMFNKKTGQFTAKIGDFSVTGKTKEDAVSELAERMHKLEQHEMTVRCLVCSNGTVFVLHHHFGGWIYYVIRTDKPGAYSPGSCGMRDMSFTDAYEAMKRHWDQMEADCATPKQSVA